MPPSSLTPLQLRILGALAAFEPRWTLTGGGALSGVHLGHRRTRDLDLFWHSHRTLPDTSSISTLLEAAGIDVDVVRRTPSFLQLRARGNDEEVLIDLVAEPVPVIAPAVEVEVGNHHILVDTPHEILVNKLCALLSRSALRDLVDVMALLAAGADLGRACRDAAYKDSGFSTATLAWVLSDMPVDALARVSGLDDGRASETERHRQQLARALAALARPER